MRVFLLIFLLIPCCVVQADRIEMLGGTAVEGTITSKDDRFVSVDVVVDGKTFSRKYAVNRVHAVVRDGKREIVTPKNSGEVVGQTIELNVDDLIAEAGRTLPSWWDETTLDIPTTLDLSYPAPILGKPLPWNNQKNIAHFVWDVVNPNSGRWRSSGIRLFHHLLELHGDDPATQQRIRNELGMMYFRFERDYARAAFWLRLAGADRPDFPFFSGVALAECFWRLGDKSLALKQLENLKTTTPGLVKLLGEMGETDQALVAGKELIEQSPTVGFLYVGDVYRNVGRNKEALESYEQALAASTGNKRLEMFRRRAEANIFSLKAFEMLDVKKIADGTYHGASFGFDGPIHVDVVVKSGRIVDVRVTEHKEKQYYSSITDTCRQIKEKQGLRGVDATSGATITSEGIINAAAQALAP